MNAIRPSLREDIQEMKPLEAVEYLLAEMDKLSAALASGAEHPVDRWGIKLTRQKRAILICLYDAGGAIRTFDQIERAAELGGRHENLNRCRFIIQRIRQSLPAGVKIVTHYRVGFSMKVAQ